MDSSQILHCRPTQKAAMLGIRLLLQKPFPRALEQQEIATVFAKIFGIVTLTAPKIVPLFVRNMSKRTKPSGYLEKIRDLRRLEDSLNTRDKMWNLCSPFLPPFSYFQEVE
jgi:hypothetical protein